MQFFTALYYNMLESKTTEKCYRILELKLNLGQKKVCKFYSNFTKLEKILKLSCIDKFMVLNLSILLEKRKTQESISFQNTHVTLGFLQRCLETIKKEKMFYSGIKQREARRVDVQIQQKRICEISMKCFKSK